MQNKLKRFQIIIFLFFFFFVPLETLTAEIGAYHQSDVLRGIPVIPLEYQSSDVELVDSTALKGCRSTLFFVTRHKALVNKGYEYLAIYKVINSKYQLVESLSLVDCEWFEFGKPKIFQYQNNKYLQVPIINHKTGQFDESKLYQLNSDNELKKVESIPVYLLLDKDEESFYSEEIYDNEKLAFEEFFKCNGQCWSGIIRGTYKIVNDEGVLKKKIDTYQKTIEGIEAKVFYQNHKNKLLQGNTLKVNSENFYTKNEVISGTPVIPDDGQNIQIESIQAYTLEISGEKTVFVTLNDVSEFFGCEYLAIYEKINSKYRLIKSWDSGFGAIYYGKPYIFIYQKEKFLLVPITYNGAGHFNASEIYHFDSENGIEEVKNKVVLPPLLLAGEEFFHRDGLYTYEDNHLEFEIFFNYYEFRCLGTIAGTYKIVNTSGQWELVIDTCEKFIAGKKADAFYENKKGDQLYHEAKFMEAIKCYETAVKKDPTFAQAFSNMGLAYSKVENDSQAIVANQKAIALQEDTTITASSYYNLGRIYEKLKQWQEALRCFDEALKLKEDPLYNKGVERILTILNGNKK